MTLLLQPLSTSQVFLLELIARVQNEHHAPPFWSYIECEFDKASLDAAQTLGSLPFVGRRNGRNYSLVWIDSPTVPVDSTKVHLTMAGRYHLATAERGNAEAFATLLKQLVAARLDIHLSPIEAHDAYISYRDLSRMAHDPTGRLRTTLFAPGQIDQIRGLVDREPVLMSAVSRDPKDETGWRILLRRELVLYKGVENLPQYVKRVTEILTPAEPEPYKPFPSPLGIVAALDYLDVVWQLYFKEKLVTPIQGERTARLALPVETQEELRAQLSSLAQLLKGLRVSRPDKKHPVQGVVPFLEGRGLCDDPALANVREAVAVLEAVVHIRNSQQHGGGQGYGAEATNKLGLSYPIIDPSHAWRIIQDKMVTALTALREEIQGLPR